MKNDNTDDRLYRDPDLACFYDLDNDWGPDLSYCAGLARAASSVLDLGCGTGLFLSRLAQDRQKRALVGADPATAMLEIARARPGGDGVTWIEADARKLRLDRRFDLIVLTGHAFQVFLTEADRRAALATIAAHLAPDGRFVFDTRNSRAEEWRTWTPEKSRRIIEHPHFGTVEAWNDAARDTATGTVTYRTHYRIAASGQHLTAESKIAFPPKDELAALLHDGGLAVETWLGNWHGTPYDHPMPEIIALGRLARVASLSPRGAAGPIP